MKKKYRVGILGATGMVGQRLICLLAEHPWFDIAMLAASPRSAGKVYSESIESRWALEQAIPQSVQSLAVYSVIDDIDTIAGDVDIVFCALSLDKDTIKEIENSYADRGIIVVSNNSAHRWTPNVPMIIPEVNSAHLALLEAQRREQNWQGGIVVKPNCSVQSYVIALEALRKFEPQLVHVTSMQAVSGAGKTLSTWPEMQDNSIPFIEGEEEKSRREPLKIWGTVSRNEIVNTPHIDISATCIRVPVSDGHMASVGVKFKHIPTREEIVEAFSRFNTDNGIATYQLPSSPSPLISFYTENDRPQIALDRDNGNGMGISIGRLRNDSALFDWEFISLAHNTIRGAAGGSVLTAELLVQQGLVQNSSV